MNNDGRGQPDVITTEAGTPLDVAPPLRLSRRQEINERLQSFRQLFVEGENAVLPRFKAISRDAVDKALHIFARINIPESSETEEPSPESDLDLKLLELWELRSGGDEAVLSKMKELFDTYQDNKDKYPKLKSRYSVWRYIAPSTITNLRAAAWLTMDDPTKFDEFLIEKGEWEEHNSYSGYSSRYNPSSSNAISTLCQALDLSFGIEGENRPTLLDIAAMDKTAQIPGFRGSKNTQRPKFRRGFDADIPEEFMPILRRALVLNNAGINSNDVVMHKTFANVNRAINSPTNDWSEASLYLLYLHQQAGLLDNPEFRGTVVKLRDTILQPYIYKYDHNLRQKMFQSLTDRYGFKFLYDQEFWDYKGNAREDEQPDILGFELNSIKAKASELKRLGPKRKFNAAASIGQSASRHISVSDEDLRKTRMYEDVKREKEESIKDELKRKKLTTQYLEVAGRTMGKVFPQENQEVPFTDETDVRASLEAFLISFIDHPELSPASKALIKRIEIAHHRGISLLNDTYQLDMRAISRDPFLSSAIRYLSDQPNHKSFMELSRSIDRERLLNMEFLTRYMAYKILNLTGTERPGSAFILHQENGDDINELKQVCETRTNRLAGMREKDSRREKRFLMRAIDKFKDQDFEDYDADSPESHRDLRQRLLEMAGKVSKEMKDFGTYLKEEKFTNRRRAAFSLYFLVIAGEILLSNPSVRENIQLPPQVGNLIRSINPFDEETTEADTANNGSTNQEISAGPLITGTPTSVATEIPPTPQVTRTPPSVATETPPTPQVTRTPTPVATEIPPTPQVTRTPTSVATEISSSPQITKTSTPVATEISSGSQVTGTSIQPKPESIAAPQRVDIIDGYESLSLEVVNNSRERQVVGKVINKKGMSNGQGLGFMPEVIYRFDYIEGQTPVSPVFMSEAQIIGEYSDNNGLVLKTTLDAKERTVPIGNRDLSAVMIAVDSDNPQITEDPLQALTNQGESEVVVFQVLSPEENTRIREVDEMRIAPYNVNNDLQAAKELLSTLNPNSRIAQVYSSMIESFETALKNNASQEEISDLLEQELRKIEENFVNQQSYSLDFEFDSASVAQQLSLTPEQGYDCNAASLLLQELLHPFGIQAGTVSGVYVSNYDGQAWTDSISHVRVLVGKPNGEVLEVDFTPVIVPGKTPEETIRRLQQTPPEDLSSDAEYVAPSHPKAEEEEALVEISTPEIPETNQLEVVLTITTLLALIGKYNNRNRVKSKIPGYIANPHKDAVHTPDARTTTSEAAIESPKKNIRTECVTNILDMFVPLSVSTPKEKVPIVQEQTIGLLYAAFALKGDQLKRLSLLIENAIEVGKNIAPIDSERNGMLEELDTIIEEFGRRLLNDDVKYFLETPDMPSRRSLLHRLMIDNGWKEN